LVNSGVEARQAINSYATAGRGLADEDAIAVPARWATGK